MSKPADEPTTEGARMQVRSRFFSSPLGPLTFEAFKEGFDPILELSSENLQLVLGELPRFVALQAFEVQAEIIELGAKLDRPPEEVFRLIRTIRFVLQKFNDEDPGPEEPSLWATDYLRFSGRDPGDFDRIAKLISALLKLAELTQLPLRSFEAARKIFPFLMFTNTAVELRGVFKKDFEDNTPSAEVFDLAGYDSTLIGVTPVVSVLLSVDSDSDLKFQVDEPGLRKLVRTLAPARVQRVARSPLTFGLVISRLSA